MARTPFKCAVPNCINGIDCDGDKNDSFYSFPNDQELLRKWLFKCGRNSSLDFAVFRVCSRHFVEDDFYVVQGTNNTARFLRNDAVPNLNLNVVKEECIIVVEDSDDDLPLFELEPIPVIQQIQDYSHKNKLDNTNFGSVEVLELKPDIESIALTPVVESVAATSTSYMPSSVPAVQVWPGQYDFKISFGPQEKNTKGVTWTYNKAANKLYVGKDVPCPINFSVNQPLPDNMQIRAHALFSSPEYASEIVTRCMSHTHDDSVKGIKDPQHLIRCESPMALYETDPVSRHNSVVVPFENPADGQQFSTYIFKFTCFGSCNGGPNRRPLSLLLTLENRGKVVGRQKLDIKICACPGRDRKSEEKEKSSEGPHMSVKRSLPGPFGDLLESLDLPTDSVPKKKPKMSSNGRYIITTRDEEQYNYLVQMKKIYNMYKVFQNLPSDIKKSLFKQAQRAGAHDSDSA